MLPEGLTASLEGQWLTCVKGEREREKLSAQPAEVPSGVPGTASALVPVSFLPSPSPQLRPGSGSDLAL